MRVRHRNKGTARHQTGTELQCDDDGEPQMTQQASASTSREDLAASPSSASSDSSTLSAIYPYSVGDKEIVLNNGTISVPQNDLIGTNSGINVVESTDVRIGHETVFNGDVTLIQHVYAQADRGPIGHASEFKKEDGIVSTPSPCKTVKAFLSHWPTQIGILAFLMLLAGTSALVVYFALKMSYQAPNPVLPDVGHRDDLGNGIQIIKRKEWLARPPLSEIKLTEPRKMVRIMHTGGSNCSNYQECANKVLALQGWMVGTKGYPDISYNYLIGGDGNVYEGRGADVQNQWQPEAIDIVYLGNYLAPYDKMSDKMEDAGKRLISKLTRDGKISPDYILVAQNQTMNTLSPGPNIYDKIIHWPHYDYGLYFK